METQLCTSPNFHLKWKSLCSWNKKCTIICKNHKQSSWRDSFEPHFLCWHLTGTVNSVTAVCANDYTEVLENIKMNSSISKALSLCLHQIPSGQLIIHMSTVHKKMIRIHELWGDKGHSFFENKILKFLLNQMSQNNNQTLIYYYMHIYAYIYQCFLSRVWWIQVNIL